MLQIENLVFASDLAEAYRTFSSEPNSVVLGGCGYLRLGARKITTAIDLTGLNLDFIKKEGDQIEIGAMTTLRALETHPHTVSLWNGTLADSVRHIVGIQLRNCVTIGGTVAGRYPFSDPITALLALNAQVELFHHGKISLEEYLEGKGMRDIVVRICIPDNGQKAAFGSIRKSATDYAILNCAVSRLDNTYRVVVGSRPGKAMRVTAAEDLLNINSPGKESWKEAGRIAAETIKFGDNPRGSGRYRKKICPVLVQRALVEVSNEA